MTSIKFRQALMAALLTMAPFAAHAHGSMKPQHGGVVQMSGETMVAFVPGSKGLSFYVTEEDEPLPASGFDGAVTLTLPGGAKSSHALMAQTANLFTAPGLAAPTGTKVLVSLLDKRSGAKTFVTFTSP